MTSISERSCAGSAIGLGHAFIASAGRLGLMTTVRTTGLSGAEVEQLDAIATKAAATIVRQGVIRLLQF